VKQKMQTPKAHKKLAKLPGAPTVFGKLRAALQSAVAFSVSSEQTESVAASEVDEEYGGNQLEVERLKAMAEEYAHNLRRRLL